MTTVLHFLLFIIFAWQEVVPYKDSSEYAVKIDYKFQERPPNDRNKVEYETQERNRRPASGPLPYLKLELTLLKLGSEEAKVKVVNSSGDMLVNRKATAGMAIKIDIGFIDDVKDRVSPSEFTVFLYSDSKKVTSRIHLVIMEDGTFMVNDEKKGNF
jgi:hypothetical protein